MDGWMDDYLDLKEAIHEKDLFMDSFTLFDVNKVIFNTFKLGFQPQYSVPCSSAEFIFHFLS